MIDNRPTATRHSPEGLSPNVHDWTGECRRRGNSYFFARVRAELDRLDPARFAGGRGAIGLIGEYGLAGMVLRHAQRHIRRDKQPSHWSHCFLFADAIGDDANVNRSPRRSPWVWESALAPAPAFAGLAAWGGVAPRRLSDYERPTFAPLGAHGAPNVAVVAFGCSAKERDAILARADNPHADELRYDFAALAGRWRAHVTDQSGRPNPLVTGEAMHCSAYVQLAYEAAGIDLAIAAHQRNTSPEHIWQTARYFAGAYAEAGHDVHVFACIRDRSGNALPPGVELPDTLSRMRELT